MRDINTSADIIYVVTNTQPLKIGILGDITESGGSGVNHTNFQTYQKASSPWQCEIDIEYKEPSYATFPDCRDFITASYTITVDDPAEILSISMNGGSTNACADTPITITTGPYYNASGIAELEIYCKDGVWRPLNFVGPAETSYTFTYFDLIDPDYNREGYIELGVPFRFRTIKNVLDGSRTTYTHPISFTYNEGIKLSEGKKIKTVPDSDGSVKILIPYEGNENYTISYKSKSGDHIGSNISLKSLPTEESGRILKSDFKKNTIYDIQIEDIDASSGKCPYTTEITIPSYPVFSVVESYPAKTSDYHIPVNGGKATMSFDIKSAISQNAKLEIFDKVRNVRLSDVNRSLSKDSTVGNYDFYSGTVSCSLSAGTYRIKVICGDWSKVFESVTLTQPNPISFKLSTTPPSCNAASEGWVSGQTSNGTIVTQSISGGIGTKTTRVYNKSTSTLIDNTKLIPGEYRIEVSDAYGNKTSRDTLLLAPPIIQVTTENPVLPSFSCTADGQITVNATGGKTPFRYSKTNGGYTTSSTVSGYAKGENKVYIKDDCGCIVEKTFNLNLTDTLAVKSITPILPTCNGDSDGECIIVMKNVKGTLSLAQKPVNSTSRISGDTIFISGLTGYNDYDYNIQLKETYNGISCYLDVSFQVREKPLISINTGVVEVANKGTKSGKIDITISGGNTDGGYNVFLYEDVDRNIPVDNKMGISTNCTFEGLSGEYEGKAYYLYVEDTKGCSAEKTIYLYEPQDILQLSAQITKPVSCYGNSDASIKLTAEGGWDTYQYSPDSINWITDVVFQNYAAGSHTFYVKDKWNGTALVTISVQEPQELIITTDSIFHVPCQGESNGWLRYKVSGGTYPYSLISDKGTVTETIVGQDTLFTIHNLPIGKYQFTVTDSHNCSATTQQDEVKEPAKLQLSSSEKTNTTCELDNGVITALATGGIPPYTYVLNDVGSSYSQRFVLNSGETVRFENLPPASYRIMVTDNNECFTASSIVIIEDYKNPSVGSIIVRDVDCFGEMNGSIKITPVQGTKAIETFSLYYNDTHIGDNTTGEFENLYAGKYNVYVSDENGCRSNYPYPVEVKEPEKLIIVIDTIFPSVQKGKKEGEIYFRVQGGNQGRKTVRLIDENGVKLDSLSAVGAFQQSFTAFTGNYTLEVEDNKHCIYSTEVLQVDEPKEALRFIITEKEDASCKSQPGRIVVEGAGGWGDYRFKRISEGLFSTLNRFDNLYPGDYLIEVTDKMGAVYRESVVIYEPLDSLRAEVTGLQPPTCGGNGGVSIKISGGAAPYTLRNNQDAETYPAAGIVQWQGYESGQQSFYLTDANGCHFELETYIPETTLLKIERFELKHPSITGEFDGSIKAFVSGGIEPYTYEWERSFGEPLDDDTNILEDIGYGYYTLLVSDAGGCSVEETVYLAEPDDLPFEIIDITHETSHNAANGQAILYADANLNEIALISPRKAIYEFVSTDVTAHFKIENDTIYLSKLESGKWHIIGASNDGKQYIGELIIDAYPEFIFNNATVTHVAAKGDATGSIKVEIKGGGGENSFTWKNSSNKTIASTNDRHSSWIESLTAGMYTITVTDKYGNQITKTVEVEEPAEKLTISLVDKKDQDCKDYEDAWVAVTAAGGWGDYQFRHDQDTYYNNGSTFTSLPTRDNYFFLIDKMGAVDSIKVEITEPKYLRASVVSVDSVKCNGNSDGSILFNITGGTPPYRFKELDGAYWIDGNHALNRSEGWYTYIFTDSHNCIGQDTLKVYVPEPDELLFKDIQVTHTTCELDNGKIVVSLQGGTRPYSYSWLDYLNVEIGTDSVITDLKQNGVYTLNVTDANGCTQYLSQLINPSTLPRVLEVETTEVLCYGETNGTARIADFVAGVPFAPYTFTWSNGDTGDYSARFEKGTHYVTIADENGCSTTYYFEITEPDSLYLNFIDVTEPQCHGYGNGYIGTETFGGKGAYSYLWSTGATTSYIEHLFRGDYWVEVTDENGCYFRKEMTLYEPEYKTLDLGEDISMCPGNTVTIDGQDFVSHRWFTSAGDVSSQRYLHINREGHYFLEATDENGCSVWGDIYVSVGNHALVADMLLPSIAAIGDTLDVIELSNMALDSIVWMYDVAVFERVYIDNDEYNHAYMAQFKCLQAGVFNIGLYAYAGGCYSPVYKQIEIVSEKEDIRDEWGVKEPLIISLSIYPNPTDGVFTVDLVLREDTQATLTLFEVASGICINQRTENCIKENKIEYNLPVLNTGTYALIVTTGNERKQVKIIIK
ncbi:T9SS type A sorting domain-containing protein [Paludibacter sp. 221]|uniref:T9SS type A sorting domain-containing protein n=1 Tax=Paludibacter sp. 221 TaxID=2302939 RepID=UPI0013D7A955|nr:T9SS type A sorting domain-containing protein [Paludibacter sp. 221]